MCSAERFVKAFNQGDIEGLAACLAPDATARVDGAPFPEERGREAIRDCSLVYLLGEEMALQARRIDHPDATVALIDRNGNLDVAIRVEEQDGLVTSLVYYTTPHRREVVGAIAKAIGLEIGEG